MSRFREFFKIHRYDIQVWSDEKLLWDKSNVFRFDAVREFEMALDELALNPKGDGFTYMVTKR